MSVAKAGTRVCLELHTTIPLLTITYCAIE